MKRRLPTINQGEFVLVAISFPPTTIDTNRQHPNHIQPGRPAAARHATVIASTAHPSGLPAGRTGSPPNSTANAANAVAHSAARAANRLHHPRAVV